MAAEEVPIEEVISELGLPKDSKFLGYVVHRFERDDFLLLDQFRPELSASAWIDDPSQARIYEDYHEALQISMKCGLEAEPCLLFDIGSQLVVAPVSG